MMIMTDTIRNTKMKYKYLDERQQKTDIDIDCQTDSFQLPPLQFPTQMTALHLAARYKSSGPVVQVLIEAGAEIEARADWQMTPLHFAAFYNTEGVDQLIKANAKVNVLSRGNESPLSYAARENRRDSVVALCKAGADPDLGHSPLTSSGVSSEMKLLIKSLL